jgi:hypothetical protein
MSITISVWWVPIILTVVLCAIMAYSASKESGFGAGFAQILGVVTGVPLIWAVFFGLMYFFGK